MRKQHYKQLTILFVILISFAFLGFACDDDDIDTEPDPTDTVPPGVSIYSVYDDEIDEDPVGTGGLCRYRCDLVPIQFDLMSVTMENYVCDYSQYEEPWLWAYHYNQCMTAPHFFQCAYPEIPIARSDYNQNARTDLIAAGRLLLENKIPPEGHLTYENGDPVPEEYSTCVLASDCKTPLGPLPFLAPLQFTINMVSAEDYPDPDEITSRICQTEGRFVSISGFDKTVPFGDQVWWGANEDMLVTTVYDKYGYPNGDYWPCVVVNDRYTFIEVNYSNNLIVSENMFHVEGSGEQEDMVIIRGGSGIPDNTDTFCTLHEFDLPFNYDCSGNPLCIDNYDDGPASFPGMDEVATTFGDLMGHFVIGGHPQLRTYDENTNGTMSSLASIWTVYFNDNPKQSSGLRSCEMTKFLPRDIDHHYYVRVQLSPSSSQISLDIGCYFLRAWDINQVPTPMICTGSPEEHPSPGIMGTDGDIDAVTLRYINDMQPPHSYLDTIEDFDWYKLEWPIGGGSSSSSSGGGSSSGGSSSGGASSSSGG